MSGRQRQQPEPTSENEQGYVRCRHIPTCTRWMHPRTRNRHWQDMLHDEAHAQGKCTRLCEMDIDSSFTTPFCQLQMRLIPTM